MKKTEPKKARKSRPRFPRGFRSWYRGYKLVDPTGSQGNAVLIPGPFIVKVGEKNVNWEKQVRAHVDATTDYKITKSSSPPKGTEQKPVYWQWQDREWIVNKYGVWTTRMEGFPHWDSLSPMAADSNTAYTAELARLDTFAKLAFLGKLKEAEMSFSSLTFLGELKETVAMIRHPLRGFIKATKRYERQAKRLIRVRDKLLRGGRRARTRRGVERLLLAERLNRLQSSLEKAFLQWTYGVAPLIGDAISMVETWDSMCKKESAEVIRLSTTLKDNLSRTSLNVLEKVGGPGRCVLVKHIVEQPIATVRYRGAVKVLLDPPESVERLRILSGFDFREFVPTFYELLPFSLVADYVSTLGSCVNGYFTSTRNLIYVTSSQNVTATRMNICVPLPSAWGVPVSSPRIPAVGRTEYFRHIRVKANLAVKFSDLRLTIPSIDQINKMIVLGTQLTRSFMGDK